MFTCHWKTRQEEPQHGEHNQQCPAGRHDRGGPVAAYGDSEQTTGWYTMLEEHLALPFETTMLGVVVNVARLDLRGENKSSPSARAVANDSPSPSSICHSHGPRRRDRVDRGVRDRFEVDDGPYVAFPRHPRADVAPGNRPADFLVTATVTMAQVRNI